MVCAPIAAGSKRFTTRPRPERAQLQGWSARLWLRCACPVTTELGTVLAAQAKKGLIAQEVHEVFPLAATYHERDDLWTLSYNRFIPLLIKAVQELEHKVGSVQFAAQQHLSL
jgi:hypothetical protein